MPLFFSFWQKSLTEMRTKIEGIEDKNEQNNETLRSNQENLEQSVQELKVSVCVMQLSQCFLIKEANFQVFAIFTNAVFLIYSSLHAFYFCCAGAGLMHLHTRKIQFAFS